MSEPSRNEQAAGLAVIAGLCFVTAAALVGAAVAGVVGCLVGLLVTLGVVCCVCAGI